jgi:hypothetical protein
MSTSLSFTEAKAQQMSAEDVRLKRIWAALPDHAVSEEEAFRLILSAADRYEGDDAWAGLMLAQLRGMGAVIGNGTVQRAPEFPILPDLIPGSQAYSDLRERENREAREREIAAANETYRRNFEASPEGLRRRELVELIDERIEARVNELVDARIKSLGRA